MMSRSASTGFAVAKEAGLVDGHRLGHGAVQLL
jgi:hypothetical protein